jgi:hypothetical protein
VQFLNENKIDYFVQGRPIWSIITESGSDLWRKKKPGFDFKIELYNLRTEQKSSYYFQPRRYSNNWFSGSWLSFLSISKRTAALFLDARKKEKQTFYFS